MLKSILFPLYTYVHNNFYIFLDKKQIERVIDIEYDTGREKSFFFEKK